MIMPSILHVNVFGSTLEQQERRVCYILVKLMTKIIYIRVKQIISVKCTSFQLSAVNLYFKSVAH